MDDASPRISWPRTLVYILLISLAAYASDAITTFEARVLAVFVKSQ